MVSSDLAEREEVRQRARRVPVDPHLDHAAAHGEEDDDHRDVEDLPLLGRTSADARCFLKARRDACPMRPIVTRARGPAADRQAERDHDGVAVRALDGHLQMGRHLQHHHTAAAQSTSPKAVLHLLVDVRTVSVFACMVCEDM